MDLWDVPFPWVRKRRENGEAKAAKWEILGSISVHVSYLRNTAHFDHLLNHFLLGYSCVSSLAAPPEPGFSSSHASKHWKILHDKERSLFKGGERTQGIIMKSTPSFNKLPLTFILFGFVKFGYSLSTPWRTVFARVTIPAMTKVVLVRC